MGGSNDEKKKQFSFLKDLFKLAAGDSASTKPPIVDSNSGGAKQSTHSLCSIGNTSITEAHYHGDNATAIVAGIAVTALVIGGVAYYTTRPNEANGGDGDEPRAGDAGIKITDDCNVLVEETEETELVAETAIVKKVGLVSIRKETKTTKHRKVNASSQQMQSGGLQETTATPPRSGVQGGDEEFRARILGYMERSKAAGRF